MVTRNNDLLMLALSRFFAVQDNVAKLINVIEGKSCVSLRLLDYFVTNFAKKHKTTLTTEDSIVICVHSSYRSQLKAFSKQQFDPFRRRERIIFKISDNQTIETTVGQLNFFRWAIESGVLHYVQEHKDEIEKDMYTCGASIVEDGSKVRDSMEHCDIKRESSDLTDHKTPNVACQIHVTQFEVPMKITFD